MSTLTPELAAKVRPIHGYVLLKFPERGMAKSMGGIIVPQEIVAESNYWTLARVVAVDPRGVPTKAGGWRPHEVKVGDVVAIYKIFGDVVVDNVVYKRELRMVSEDQISAVVDDPEITEDAWEYII